MPDEPTSNVPSDTDADDDARDPSEFDSIGSMSAWTVDPTRLAREFRRKHPDAAIDISFPVVYEEDRSKMITDLSAARAEGAIGHQRLAERIVKELGFEGYDYEAEQQQIGKEQPAVPRMPSSEPGPVGAGDRLAACVVDDDDEDTPEHRAALSGDARRRFRRQQKSLGESAPPTPAPVIVREVERDDQGRAQRIVEVDDSGHLTINRIVRDPTSGRITGLEREVSA
jgi:hypothetical protein